ncbi:hypothetical protein R1flu_004587 [Riccia fluitans]|uniref:AP2/ERF domain-containing protein n=1 Tax=Riccia fluitans TaxID=41844 RepID=A0ABD1YQR5_9MARC
MSGMTFFELKHDLRKKSREMECRVVNKAYKGILIDQHGRWEVKYLLKDNGRRGRFLLVGWYEKEEDALRAYNETALRYDGPRATISGFHQKGTRIRKRSTLMTHGDKDRVDLSHLKKMAPFDVNISL